MKDSQKQKKKPSSPKKLSTIHPLAGFREINAVIRKYETDITFILLPAILGTIFVSLLILNQYTTRVIKESEIGPAGSVAQIYPYPLVTSSEMPEISAKAAIIVDADSQVILFAKKPSLRFSMASTTKIMTALTALDYYTPKSVLTVKTAHVEGSSLGLQVGEKFYFEDMLYMMMLPSANDAAITIADNYPGGKDAFVRQMNSKAVALHLTNTHFGEPTGLDDDFNYTTVVDMARLASIAIKDSRFTQVTGTKEKIVANLNRTKTYPLSNLNKLLGFNGVTGIKTGTTEGAGEVLVTSTQEKGHTYVIVVMNSQQRFVDTQTLLWFIEQNVRYIYPTGPIRQ